MVIAAVQEEENLEEAFKSQVVLKENLQCNSQVFLTLSM